MRQQGIDFFFRQEKADFTFGVIEVAKNPDRVHAGCHTGRLFAFGHIVVAETAFFHDAFFIGLPDVVGTGGHAHFAADAFLGIHMNDSVRRFISGLSGTDRLAGRIVAVHTLNWEDFLTDFGESSLFAKLQAIIESVRRQLPLHLAGNAAGAAAGAFGRVDQHGVSGHQLAPFLTLTITSCTMQPPDSGSTREGAKSL